MARPRKTTTLERVIGVRVTPEEFSEIQSRARASYLPISTWLREAALGRKLPTVNPVPTMEIWGILGRVLAGIGIIKEGATEVDPRAFDMLASLVEDARRKLVQ